MKNKIRSRNRQKLLKIFNSNRIKIQKIMQEKSAYIPSITEGINSYHEGYSTYTKRISNYHLLTYNLTEGDTKSIQVNFYNCHYEFWVVFRYDYQLPQFNNTIREFLSTHQLNELTDIQKKRLLLKKELIINNDRIVFKAHLSVLGRAYPIGMAIRINKSEPNLEELRQVIDTNLNHCPLTELLFIES